MSESKITVILNGNHYHLKADDENSVASMADADRKSLLALLRSIEKHQEKTASEKSPVSRHPSATIKPAGASSVLTKAQQQQLNNGDVENLAAQIMMLNKKTEPKKSSNGSMVKWVFAVVVAGCLLALFM